MSWNGIGIGWPNATSGGGPVPTTERYLLASCTGITGPCTTPDFPIGTYVVNDRLRYEYQGYPQFGLVDSITTAPEDNVIDIYPTGVNTTQCIDNYLNLYGNVIIPYFSTQITIDYFLEPLTTSFASSEDEYPFIWGYYYEVFSEYIDGDGNPATQFNVLTNSGSLINYTMAEASAFLINQTVFTTDGYITYYEIQQYFSNNPYFYTIAAFPISDCSSPYFMRTQGTQSGSTFFINFQANC